MMDLYQEWVRKNELKWAEKQIQKRLLGKYIKKGNNSRRVRNERLGSNYTIKRSYLGFSKVAKGSQNRCR